MDVIMLLMCHWLKLAINNQKRAAPHQDPLVFHFQ